MKIGATIQARMGSTRLPGKVLRPILGKPMLEHQIERIGRSMLIDEIIIATSTNSNDDPIVDLASRLDLKCFRGSEEKVLERVIGALTCFNIDLNVDFCVDCPLVDSTIVDAIIGVFLKNQDRVDYVGTGLRTTFPPGMDVVVYRSSALFDVAKHIRAAEELEYAAVNIRSRPDIYRTMQVDAPDWYHYPQYSLEVDTAEDFKLVEIVYNHFCPRNPHFLLKEIIQFLKENPAIAELNRHVFRRWKVYREES